MYEKFEKLLTERGVTPYRVHKETGISTATLSDWKNGKSQPKQDKIEKICEYFNVSPSYFYGAGDESQLSKKDERDIAKDMENIVRKLRSNEDGPASFEGDPIPEEDIDLLAGQIELMLRRLKPINKEKYNPNKNKK